MNNVFDRGFHLGDGAATESDKRNGSDYSSAAAGYVNPLPGTSDLSSGPSCSYDPEPPVH